MDLQARCARYIVAKRFIEQIANLAQHGIAQNGSAVLIDPVALGMLTSLAGEVNEFMGSVAKYEEAQHLFMMDQYLVGMASIQEKVERQ